MGKIAGCSETALSMAEALGLPSHCKGFTLRCYVGEAITVEAEYFAEDRQVRELTRVLTDKGWEDKQ